MRVLLVGGGGREHALAWRLSRSPSVDELLVTDDNPGFDGIAQRVAGGEPAQIASMARAMRVGLVVVGPEAPLADGLADACAREGVPCFGPTREAARLESSKAFAKRVMAEAGVPTAAALIVDTADDASLAAGRARCARGEVAIKADGLAAGKGVVVCVTPDEAITAFDALRDGRLGAAARFLLLEDRLVGPEVSLFALCDGERAVPLISAQDHKRLLDGDNGPNTGGMGAYAPCPLVDAAAARALTPVVFTPILAALAARGAPFRGVLFAGLMLTPAGVRVLEYNVRFGDPECEVLMPLWRDDPLPWLLGAANGALPPGEPSFEGAACAVVLASRGYPASSQAGVPIPSPGASPNALTFFAGARREGDQLVTSGGRVLAVTGLAPTPAGARVAAYAAVDGWRFDGCQSRTDIGEQLG